MTITGIERRRGRQVELTLSDGRTLLLDRSTWEETAYTVGSWIDEERLAALSEASEQRRAKEYALYLLSLRDYSEAELRRKLREHGCRDKAAETTARMMELGLVNDEVYARRFARDCRIRKCYSRRRTVQELSVKGVARLTAETAVDEVDEAENLTDVQQALALLQKKRYTCSVTEQERVRGCLMLQRNGYDTYTVREAWRLLSEDAESGPDNSFETGE